MTVSSTLARWSYTGNGTAGPFTYTTKIFVKTDLKVYVADVLKTVDTHYTVTVGDSGNVTFTSGNEPANGASIVIVKDVPNTQGTSLPLGGQIPSSALEAALDKVTILVQQASKRATERVLRQPDSDAADIGEIPIKSARLGRYLRFNETTGEPEAADISDLGTIVLSDADPEDIGTASPGTSEEVSRADHVHALVPVVVAANEVTYNNGVSGLTADDVQAAIDELAAGTGSAGNTVELSRQTAANVASLDFTGIDATYDVHIFDIIGIRPASDDVAFGAQIGTGATPTYQTSGYTYGGRSFTASAGADRGSTTDSISDKFLMTPTAGAGNAVGNASDESISGEFRIYMPSNGSKNKHVRWESSWTGPNGVGRHMSGGGDWDGVTAITAAKFFFNSGNITDGTIVHRAIKK
jgi:hypothetical protein